MRLFQNKCEHIDVPRLLEYKGKIYIKKTGNKCEDFIWTSSISRSFIKFEGYLGGYKAELATVHYVSYDERPIIARFMYEALENAILKARVSELEKKLT